MEILKADRDDLQEILDLQYLAFQKEATILNDFDIQPLTQTIDQVEDEFNQGIILKAIDENGKIIGSVRGYTRENTFYMGKLIVHPSCQSQGIASSLVRHIEKLYKRFRIEIFTNANNEHNMGFYNYLGFSVFDYETFENGFKFAYLEKNL